MPKLIDPDTGRTVRASREGAVVLRRRGYVDAGGAAPPAVAERPAGNASRQAWDEYARSVGMDPGEYESRADLIDAIDGRGD